MSYITASGYAEMLYECEFARTRYITYVPINRNKKVIVYEIENRALYPVDVEVLYQFEPVLGVAREYTKKHLLIKRCENFVSIKNSYRDFYQDEEVKIYVDKDFELLESKDKIVTIKSNLKIDSGEKGKIIIEVSVDKNLERADESQDLQALRDFWDEMLRKNPS